MLKKSPRGIDKKKSAPSTLVNTGDSCGFRVKHPLPHHLAQPASSLNLAYTKSNGRHTIASFGESAVQSFDNGDLYEPKTIFTERTKLQGLRSGNAPPLPHVSAQTRSLRHPSCCFNVGYRDFGQVIKKLHLRRRAIFRPNGRPSPVSLD